MTEVILSGASGDVGLALRPAPLGQGVDLRSACGRRPVTPPAPVARRYRDRGFVTPDLTRADQHPRASGGGR
jgi:hypothetical protein